MNIRKLKNLVVDKFKNESRDDLHYHSLDHTLYVLKVCNDYIKRLKIDKHDAYLLRTAALLHDIGFFWTYDNHEEIGLNYVREILPEFGYSSKEIKRISSMILATRLPQQPKNILEKILCDADLDYLGTDLFYPIGNLLLKEFMAYGYVKKASDWNDVQINFLETHYYHTEFARRNREPVKQAHIAELKAN